MPEQSFALALLFVVGIVSGAINIIAGGGSLLSLPALIFFGMPATVANGTNRLGIVVQSITATIAFRRQGIYEGTRVSPLMIPCCVGSLFGALLSTDIPEEVLRLVIGAAMLVLLLVMLARPSAWLHQRKEPATPLPMWAQWLLFAVIGTYAGFLQAGVGVFMLAALVLASGHNLVQGNAVKVALVSAFTTPALVVFIYNDMIDWVPGLVYAAGSMVGGYVGSRMTVSWGPNFVRAILIVVVVISSSKLFGLW